MRRVTSRDPVAAYSGPVGSSFGPDPGNRRVFTRPESRSAVQASAALNSAAGVAVSVGDAVVVPSGSSPPAQAASDATTAAPHDWRNCRRGPVGMISVPLITLDRAILGRSV